MVEEKCQQILARVDAWVTARPERRGVGYHNSQKPGSYDPALGQVRSVLEGFVGLLLRRGLGGAVLQLGLGRHGGMHYALSLLGGRVVTVEREEAWVAAYLEDQGQDQGLDPEREAILVGDPCEASIMERVRALLPEVDVLLLAGGESCGELLREWKNYAPLVRAGGVVAFCDGSQAFARLEAEGGRGERAREERLQEERGVGRFLFQLERDYLLPRQARPCVFHADKAILYYEQSQEMREEWARGDAPVLELPKACLVAEPCESLVEDWGGFSIHQARGSCWAVPGEGFDPNEVSKDRYPLVLKAGSPEEARELVRDFLRAEQVLAESRALLAEGRLDEALGRGAALVGAIPGLRERLLPSYHAYQYSARLGLVLGSYQLFADGPREGWHLLQKVLRRNYQNQELIQVLAQVAMEVLRDPALGRELLEEVRGALRRAEVGRICREELSGSLLWDYPEFLGGIRGALHVGAGSGRLVEGLDRLGVQTQVLIEPEPRARQALAQKFPVGGEGGHPILALAAGAEAAEGQLRRGLRGWGTSLAEVAEGFAGQPALAQEEGGPVPVRSLDGLVAEGVLPAQGLDLLLIDAGGRELDVLRGAERFLAGVDLVRTKVFFAPVFQDTPEPEELRLYLQERGFWLRAYQPGPQGLWGEALFRRTRRRRT